MLRATALAPILRNGITKEVENFAHQKKTPRLRPARFGRPTLLEFCPPPASRASGDFGELYLDALNAPGCSKVLFEFLQQPVPHELCRGS